MKVEALVYCGGVFHLVGALWDASWPTLWNWKSTLAGIDDLQKNILLILHKLMITFYLCIAYLSLSQAPGLVNSQLGNCVLLVISVFWLSRAIVQVRYFGLFDKANGLRINRSMYPRYLQSFSNQTLANALLVLILVGVALYSIPLALIFLR